jgi:uncharacterized membrane protein YtjA (UPF0391 family)
VGVFPLPLPPFRSGEGCGGNNNQPPINMLNYAIIFLIIAILAGVLGFGVVAGTAAMVAKVCFVVFLVLFLFSLLGGGRRLP